MAFLHVVQCKYHFTLVMSFILVCFVLVQIDTEFMEVLAFRYESSSNLETKLLLIPV